MLRPKTSEFLCRFARDDRGATVVEFALVAVPFFMMLYAIFDVSLRRPRTDRIGGTPLVALPSPNPKVRILWAHAGMSEPPAVIADMMARHLALWADLSYREVTSGTAIDAEWRALLLRFPQRFLYGSDTWMPFRWPQVPALARAARDWLRQLPPDVAENIAWRNAEALYGP